MKKIYMAPAVELQEAMVSQMMALSIQTGAADDSDVLVKEDYVWSSDLDCWE